MFRGGAGNTTAHVNGQSERKKILHELKKKKKKESIRTKETWMVIGSITQTPNSRKSAVGILY